MKLARPPQSEGRVAAWGVFHFSIRTFFSKTAPAQPMSRPDTTYIVAATANAAMPAAESVAILDTSEVSSRPASGTCDASEVDVKFLRAFARGRRNGLAFRRDCGGDLGRRGAAGLLRPGFLAGFKECRERRADGNLLARLNE